MSSARLSTMRRALLVVVALAASLSLPVATAPCAHACSCPRSTTAEQVAAADVVVVGTVRSVQGPEPASGDMTYTLEVDEPLRGEVPATVRVVSQEMSASCGYRMAPGSSHLLMATWQGSRLRVSLCSGSARATPASVDEARDAVAVASVRSSLLAGLAGGGL